MKKKKRKKGVGRGKNGLHTTDLSPRRRVGEIEESIDGRPLEPKKKTKPSGGRGWDNPF